MPATTKLCASRGSFVRQTSTKSASHRLYEIRRSPCTADAAVASERVLHRASSLPQSPINLPVKQIPGLSGVLLRRRADARIRVLREIDRDDSLARAARRSVEHPLASHISSSKIVWESSKRDSYPRGCRTWPLARLLDQLEPEAGVFWCNDLPRDSQPREIHGGAPLFVNRAKTARARLFQMIYGLAI